MESLTGASRLLGVKGFMDGGFGWEVGGEIPTGGAIEEHVEKNVDDIPPVVAAGLTAGGLIGQEWADHLPLDIGLVRGGAVRVTMVWLQMRFEPLVYQARQLAGHPLSEDELVAYARRTE